MVPGSLPTRATPPFFVVDVGSDRARGRAGPRTSYFQLGNAPFWAVHLAALAGVVYFGPSPGGVALALGAYFARMALVTAGYHRYFAHRAFKTSRAFQLILAVLAQSSAQKGVLWWATTTAATTSTRTPPWTCTLPYNAGSGTRTWAGS